MLFLSAVLVLLVAAGVFLAARELAGFQPEPEWKDVGKMRDRLAGPLPETPGRGNAGKLEIVAYCARLRREYYSAWRLCRFLAPITGDPAYVGTLLANRVRFDAILLLAMFCAGSGCSRWCDRLLHELRRLSSSIRSSALLILTQSDFEQGLTAA